MFGRLTDLLNNVKKLDESKIFLKVVSSQGVQAFIISLNTVDQIFLNSEQSDGTPITSGRITKQKTKGYYSQSTFEPPYDKGVDNPFTIRSVVDIDETGGIIYGSESMSVSAGDSYILFQEGTYLETYRVVVDNGGFTLTSNDGVHSNTGLSSMSAEYGKLEGLTDESKNKLTQEILPMVIREVRTILLS